MSANITVSQNLLAIQPNRNEDRAIYVYVATDSPSSPDSFVLSADDARKLAIALTTEASRYETRVKEFNEEQKNKLPTEPGLYVSAGVDSETLYAYSIFKLDTLGNWTVLGDGGAFYKSPREALEYTERIHRNVGFKKLKVGK